MFSLLFCWPFTLGDSLTKALLSYLIELSMGAHILLCYSCTLLLDEHTVVAASVVSVRSIIVLVNVLPDKWFCFQSCHKLC